ncbi:MAG: hypothetical protein GX425_05610 [Peptococcaceae bacterium]|nr:hypothetical protein [Peptococcaceae bacterium]
MNNCMHCGAKLIYKSAPELMTCVYCEKEQPAAVFCVNGHFICEECHGSEIQAVIEEFLLQTSSADPLATAELLLAHPKMPFLGREHHPVVAGSILAALKNHGQFQVRGKLKTIADEEIKEGIRRMWQIPSCSCAFQGACGAGLGVGAAFSVIYEATCAKDVERTLQMRAANAVLEAIANLGGPGCCKQSVRTALEVAVELLKEHFNVILPVKRSGDCRFPPQNSHGCKGVRCRYSIRNSQAQ